MEIGTHMRNRRRDLGLSQEALAREAGVSLNLVNKIERGVVTDPHYSTLAGVAEALGMSIAELVGEEAPGVPLGEGPEPRTSSPEELRNIREILLDVNAMIEEWGRAYRDAGDESKLATLIGATGLLLLGTERFVGDEVGFEGEDRAHMRVYTAGARLEETFEDLLEALEALPEEVREKVVHIADHWQRTKAA